MKVFHFCGQGYGAMAGVDEYVVFSDSDTPPEDFLAPGFKLESQVETGDLPGWFPIDTVLAVHR